MRTERTGFGSCKPARGVQRNPRYGGSRSENVARLSCQRCKNVLNGLHALKLLLLRMHDGGVPLSTGLKFDLEAAENKENNVTPLLHLFALPCSFVFGYSLRLMRSSRCPRLTLLLGG